MCLRRLGEPPAKRADWTSQGRVAQSIASCTLLIFYQCFFFIKLLEFRERKIQDDGSAMGPSLGNKPYFFRFTKLEMNKIFSGLNKVFGLKKVSEFEKVLGFPNFRVFLFMAF